MTNIINSFIDNATQCWGCGVFDRLFQITSTVAAELYTQMTQLMIGLFMLIFAVFVVNSVYQTIKNAGKDPFYQKSVLKVVLNSIVVLSLMVAGIGLPRLVTRVTAEPAATATLVYTQALTKQDNITTNTKVTYEPTEMSDDGFFRPQLRNTIIMIMKTTITQFQNYMKLGVAIMDKAFSWSALLGIGALIKHIALFVIGFYLLYGFFKLFIRFCFYFVDIIIAMALFAFFFPVSLMLMAFDGADHLPDVVKNVGKRVSKDQINKLINAIVTLASCVLTYTIIMTVITKFFSDPDTTNAELMDKILSGNVFEADLNDDNLEAMTLMSTIVLLYVLNFMYKQIPQITKMIMGLFGVAEEKQYGDKMADAALGVSKNIVNVATSVGKTVIDGFKGKKDDEAKE